MKERLVRIAKWVAYPLFYLFCLVLFGYLTFPYARVKDRLIAEFEKRGKPGQHLQIDKLTSYWFTGVEVSGVKLTLPASSDDAASMGGMSGMPGMPKPPTAEGAAGGPKDSMITIDEGHARVRFLPLLIGRVRVDFWVSALGGEISGTVPVGGAGDVALALDKVDIGKLDLIGQAAGVPLKGVVTGKLALSAVDGKFSKANGSFDVSIADIVVGDGVTKIQGLIELPAAKVGTLTISADAKDGALKITKLSAMGSDVELVGDGRIGVKEPWNDSNADLYLRFKFADPYRAKNDTTKTLFGDPASTVPGLIEMQVPKMKKAKRADGFYGWHVYGPLKNLKFDASATDTTAPSNTAAAAKPKKAVELKKPGGGGLALPLGTSQAKLPEGEDRTAPSPPPPPPTPSPPPQLPAPVAPASQARGSERDAVRAGAPMNIRMAPRETQPGGPDPPPSPDPPPPPTPPTPATPPTEQGLPNE